MEEENFNPLTAGAPPPASEQQPLKDVPEHATESELAAMEALRIEKPKPEPKPKKKTE